MYFWYGNAAARTFGRAHRRRPYGFVWGLRAGRLVAFGWIAHGTVGVVWGNVRWGLFLPSHVAPFIFTNGFDPFFGHGDGMVFEQVVGHHHCAPHAFHGFCLAVDELLCECEALGADGGDGCLHFHLVGAIDLCEEVGFDVCGEDGIALVGDVAHLAHVIDFCGVVVLKIGCVVDVSELVGIGKSELDGKAVVKCYLFHRVCWYFFLLNDV